MIVALGHSEDLDSPDAIAEALDQCAETLGDHTPQAGLLYAGIDHDFQDLLDGIEARYPGLQLIGCTTHGELSSGGFAEDSDVPAIGFYTNGEICPLPGSQTPFTHAGTFVTVLLGESQ